MPHYTLPRLLSHQVEITLIGAGGNGSQMLTGLARMNHALTALGHPGLFVQTFDPDTVSESNIGRQLFSQADIGQHKAILLTHRLNAFFGLRWEARPTAFDADLLNNARIIICCVDSRRARHAIADAIDTDRYGAYFMDLGNRASDGQVVLGQWDATEAGNAWPAGKRPADHVSLENPYHVLPELVDITIPEDTAPSCGIAEALEKQDLFINQSIVTPALNILWHMLRYGRLAWHGAFVNLKTGNMRPLMVKEIA
jgi:PRTRC genetic system ThiF family protein